MDTVNLITDFDPSKVQLLPRQRDALISASRHKYKDGSFELVDEYANDIRVGMFIELFYDPEIKDRVGGGWVDVPICNEKVIQSKNKRYVFTCLWEPYITWYTENTMNERQQNRRFWIPIIVDAVLAIAAIVISIIALQNNCQ